MSPKPQVEIAAVITDAEGKIVIGKKKGKRPWTQHNRTMGVTHVADATFCYAGLYEFPGGNLKLGEEIFACAERETLQETGLKVKGKKVIAYTNDVQKEDFKHEVTLYVLCEREDASAQPKVSPYTSYKLR